MAISASPGQHVAQVLRRWSFLPEPSMRGPFAPMPGVACHVARTPGRLLLAFVPDGTDAGADAALLERLELGAFGYDVDGQAGLSALEAIGELTILSARPGSRLAAAGFAEEDGFWQASDAECMLPEGGAEWGGAVYPALGHVAAPPDPPWTTHPVLGFYVAALPAGVSAAHRLRGLHFVHDVPMRRITRRRLVMVLEPEHADWPALDAALAMLSE